MFPPIQHLSAHLPPGGGIYNYTPLPPLLFDPSPPPLRPPLGKIFRVTRRVNTRKDPSYIYSVFLSLILCITKFSQLRPNIDNQRSDELSVFYKKMSNSQMGPAFCMGVWRESVNQHKKTISKFLNSLCQRVFFCYCFEKWLRCVLYCSWRCLDHYSVGQSMSTIIK
jgi:hypothetical protein